MLIKSDIIITDEDPGLRIESFAIIKLRGVTTNYKIYFFTTQTLKELNPLIPKPEIVKEKLSLKICLCRRRLICERILKNLV